MTKTIIILGSGFSALAASCYLAKQGHAVTIYEKNPTIGGRARQFKKDGFTFDMGPSWYWMPDVFDRFFQDFGKKTSDYYELIKLNPAYRVYFGVNDFVSIYDNLTKIKSVFETIEKGSGDKLHEFIDQAKSNYDIAIKDLVYRPGVSPLELLTPKTALKLNQFLSNVSQDIRKKFKNERLIQILEFPVLFLGAKPTKTPSFYNFMNYADFGLGTWHPKTGMFDVVRGIEKLALELGVTIKTNSSVEKIIVENKTAIGVVINGEIIKADLILSGADYQHTETLLDKEHRAYSEKYWESRIFAPSSLLFFIGFNKKIENISHHALFFDVDFDEHAKAIYDDPKWPKAPLFYANFPSKTDLTAAPEGMESGFFLIPLAPGIEDNEELREQYFEKIVTRFEQLTQQKIKNNIIFKKSFCKNDFVTDYNAYKGNAYGMANTLLQTAFLRPKLKSKKVRNLYFTGQLTVPGPGVPPALISGKLVAELIQKSIRS
ncbi:phytoene desaturase family protein [Flavobacterium daemonense]|uniref:phytoene desaturase family protein n=1 Tax=Flavobacterium daemonense TaxID=1393049 RepID=UPI0011854A6A|nr:phytoene desaturase family protein [Flavobacterium daemonense]KAF2330299.1 phytoene desaturase [Flavobacterium daemonense]